MLKTNDGIYHSRFSVKTLEACIIIPALCTGLRWHQHNKCNICACVRLGIEDVIYMYYYFAQITNIDGQGQHALTV